MKTPRFGALKRLSWLLVFGLATALVLPAPAAHAHARDKVAQAKILFRAGARAYDAGKFDVAAQAFEQAYELTPKPALRFSAAQALRRHYALVPDAALLHKALAYYKAYVAEVKEGSRVRDAAEAMGEIQLLLAQLGEAGAAPTTPTSPAQSVERKGKLNIAASVDDAIASVDGGKPIELPTWVDLAPGRHQVVVSARGYQSVERHVIIEAGRVAAVDPELREKPALLSVEADAGADVLVDGRPVGRAPLARPVELPSGEHRVVVGDNGYRVFVEDVRLKRGQEKKIEAELGMTAQRIASWVFFGGAALAAVGGVVLTVQAVSEQRQAQELKDGIDAAQRPMSVEEAEDYNGKLSRRDNLARGAAGAYALAGLSAGVGLLLFALDEPELSAASSEPDKKEKKRPDLEGHLGPLPGGAMLTLRGRF